MSSTTTPKWKRYLYKILPFLWKTCPEGNYHSRWDRLCFCRENEHCGDEWHGGIYDFKTGEEYLRYKEEEKPENTARANLNGDIFRGSMLDHADPSFLEQRLAAANLGQRRLGLSELAQQIIPVEPLGRNAPYWTRAYFGHTDHAGALAALDEAEEASAVGRALAQERTVDRNIERWRSDKVAIPGSDLARAHGCTCPHYEDAPEASFVKSMKCPMHGEGGVEDEGPKKELWDHLKE